jgi:hypothetical protein
MKRTAAALTLALFACVFVSARKEVLIDFTLLSATSPASMVEQSTVDYSKTFAAVGFSETLRQTMNTTLELANWEVDLSPSSRTVVAQRYTKVLEVTTTDDRDILRFGTENYRNMPILGIRVRFPDSPIHSWALVRPPFDIPAYGTVERGTTQFDGIGVVKNVGTIKEVTVVLYGRNFPHRFSIILQDQDLNQQEIILGTLRFEGWRQLTWPNPNYIAEVRDRELRQLPLYPQSIPFVKLIGMRIHRDASHLGGDAVVYVKEIQIEFDEALPDVRQDINDEQFWRIVTERQEDRRDAELERLGNLQVLRSLERLRRDGNDGNDDGEILQGGR